MLKNTSANKPPMWDARQESVLSARLLSSSGQLPAQARVAHAKVKKSAGAVELKIGSGQQCDLRLDNSDFVSPIHASIRLRDGVWCVINLSEHVNVSLNGRRIYKNYWHQIEVKNYLDIGLCRLLVEVLTAREFKERQTPHVSNNLLAQLDESSVLALTDQPAPYLPEPTAADVEGNEETAALLRMLDASIEKVRLFDDPTVHKSEPRLGVSVDDLLNPNKADSAEELFAPARAARNDNEPDDIFKKLVQESAHAERDPWDYAAKAARIGKQANNADGQFEEIKNLTELADHSKQNIGLADLVGERLTVNNMLQQLDDLEGVDLLAPVRLPKALSLFDVDGQSTTAHIDPLGELYMPLPGGTMGDDGSLTALLSGQPQMPLHLKKEHHTSSMDSHFQVGSVAPAEDTPPENNDKD